jgi:hypothetical protein
VYLLLLLSLGAEALSTLLLLEELSLLVGGLGSLGLDEVGVVDGLGDLDGRDVNLGRGGDNVGLRDSSEGNTVDDSGSGDEEETRGELSEVDDSLSSVSSGEEDEDGSGGDRRSETGGLKERNTARTRMSRRFSIRYTSKSAPNPPLLQLKL